MPLKQMWLRWIEKRLWSGEPVQAPAHLAQGQAREADLREMQDLVETLEAIPAALSRLPWQKERLWPAIRAALPVPSPALQPKRWAGWVSSALLLVVVGGLWWGSVFSVAPAATIEASYSAQPPVTPRLLVTPLQEARTGNNLPRPALPSGTPQPLPAPAQTPIFAGTVHAGTVAPGG